MVAAGSPSRTPSTGDKAKRRALGSRFDVAVCRPHVAVPLFGRPGPFSLAPDASPLGKARPPAVRSGAHKRRVITRAYGCVAGDADGSSGQQGDRRRAGVIPPIKAPLRARSESVAVAMAQLAPVAIVRTALAHQRAGPGTWRWPEPTYHRQRAQYGGIEGDDAERLR